MSTGIVDEDQPVRPREANELLIVLLGPPGAGKGTQSQRVAEELGVPKVATGDIFRDAITRGTALGLEAKPFIERGELVPDRITTEMVRERLARADCARGAVMDGFPRTLDQARQLDTMLEGICGRISAVVNIDVSTDELLRRMSGRWTCRQCQQTYHEVLKPPRTAGVCDRCGGALFQRQDDRLDVARTRLRVYETRTEPVIAYYREKGLLTDVNGEQSPDVVLSDILGVVDGKRQS